LEKLIDTAGKCRSSFSLLPGLLFLFSLFVSLNSFSQRKSDIGVFAGTNYYMGDLNPSKQFYLPGYSAGPIFRYNFEPRNSIRVSALYSKLQGNTSGYGDAYVESLNTSFNTNLVDFAANYEFNFIPYKTANRKLKQSLYLTAGLGYYIVLSTSARQLPSSGFLSNNHLTIPFGMGYKFNATKKLSAGFEITERKTFNDSALDGMLNIGSESEKALLGNKDWYTFAGIFITYKIFSYREDCPAYND
jgi:hypothetical protein